MRECVGRVRPEGFFGCGKAHLLRVLHGEVRRIPKAFHAGGWVPGSRRWAPEGGAGLEGGRPGRESPALVTFTSGSTGRPKAAARTHGFLLEQFEALRRSLDYREGIRSW